MEERTTGNTESALASTGTVLDWAIQFYCAADDAEMVSSLVQMDVEEVSKDQDYWYQSDNEPLCLLFFRLDKFVNLLKPAYLGLEESEETLNRQQPWASPLNLQHMAKSSATDYSKDAGSVGSSPVRTTLEPFSSPFNSPQRSIQQRRPQSPLGILDAKCLEVPAMIRWLIIVENARRRSATEYLDWKHAQGSVGEQSERWQHHFAKRNIAAEIKFENILVALKELVVLQSIVRPESTLTGQLGKILDCSALGQHRQSGGESMQALPNTDKQGVFNVARCLAVLNLMFPLGPLHANTRYSDEENRMRHRFAMPLQHVPSPRIQLLQLLCETEAWVSGDDRVTVSIATGGAHNSFGQFDQLSQSADDQADGLGDGSGVNGDNVDQCSSKRVGDQGQRTPSNCPTWLAAARRFAWGQLKQSCHAYLRYTRHRIEKQHYEMHPWDLPTSSTPEYPTIETATAQESFVNDSADNCIAESDASQPTQTRSASQRITNAILSENNELLREVQHQMKPNTTVLERIVRHSRLVKTRFSPYATYSALTK
ncbi:hypothetical protein H4R24_000618 [Coemansia sp. RSA 988]|nr:hypothetical protein H4R24_000618 [Coemansia sp. RSA 988]